MYKPTAEIIIGGKKYTCTYMYKPTAKIIIDDKKYSCINLLQKSS